MKQSLLHHRRLHRFRDVVNGLFSLIVFLSAFAITDVPIRKTEDIGNVLCYFVPMFFFVIALWTQIGELLDLHPPHDRGAEKSITVVLFFALLVPVALKAGLTTNGEPGSLSFDYFPIMMALVFGLLAFTSHRLLRRLSQSGEDMHPDDLAHLRRMRGRDLCLLSIFLLSLPIPPTAEVLGLSWEGIVWTGAFLVAPLLLNLFGRTRARWVPRPAAGVGVPVASPLTPPRGP